MPVKITAPFATAEDTAEILGVSKKRTKELKNMVTGSIRRIIYDRQAGRCIMCDLFVGWNQAHLHEKLSRGKGGKISLDNSEILCYRCHILGEHGDRKPKFRGGKDGNQE